MRKRTQKHGVLKIAGIGGLAVLLLGVGLQLASADENAGTRPVSVVCPTVADKLGAVPAAARGGVDSELRNLENQIANVNSRLAREPRQAANQLNDIAGKRRAVLERISLNITRVGGTAPAGLAGLANCTLSTGAGAGNGTTTGTGNGNGAPAAGNAGTGTAVQVVNCPTVQNRLPAVPAQAAAEVQRELANLERQIAEANARLARLAVRPEGGPNFVQNAIVGPLEDKRVAVLNRIATAIGRVNGNRPANLVALAPCSVGAAAGAGAAPAQGNGAPTRGNAPAQGNGATGGRVQTVNCPSVADKLPPVPAAAAAGVNQELANLERDIANANARLARQAANPQGGPNFVRNTILNPLKDKRVAVLDRIAINISRVTGQRPAGLENLAPCTLNG